MVDRSSEAYPLKIAINLTSGHFAKRRHATNDFHVIKNVDLEQTLARPLAESLVYLALENVDLGHTYLESKETQAMVLQPEYCIFVDRSSEAYSLNIAINLTSGYFAKRRHATNHCRPAPSDKPFPSPFQEQAFQKEPSMQTISRRSFPSASDAPWFRLKKPCEACGAGKKGSATEQAKHTRTHTDRHTLTHNRTQTHAERCPKTTPRAFRAGSKTLKTPLKAS